MDGFESAALKLDRAEHHLQDFNHELARFLQLHPYGGTTEPHPHEPFKILRIEVVGRVPFPPILRLLVGDFAYCLRSALDHVIWALSQPLPPKKNRLQIEFPIFDSPAKFASDSPKKIGALPIGVQQAVERLQPYHCGTGADSHPLWRLYWLCNSDKHRVLSVVATGIYFSGMSGMNLPGPNDWFIPFPDNLATDPQIPLPTNAGPAHLSQHAVNLQIRPAIGIVPDEGPRIETGELQGVYDFVRNTAIPKIRAAVP